MDSINVDLECGASISLNLGESFDGIPDEVQENLKRVIETFLEPLGHHILSALLFDVVDRGTKGMRCLQEWLRNLGEALEKIVCNKL